MLPEEAISDDSPFISGRRWETGFMKSGGIDIRRFHADESGQTLVLAALCMVVIVGMLGLSIDAGLLRYQKRQMQTLADASALAAALEVQACSGTANCTLMTTAAKNAVTENGFSSSVLLNCATRSGTKLELTVNNPPCALASDPNAGNASYVETVVSAPVSTVFARVLGVNSVNISARAEAATKSPTQCTYFLSQVSTQPSLSVTNQSLKLGCGLYLGQSYNFSGASSTGGQYTVVGSSSSSTGSVSPAPIFSAAVMNDPLSNLKAPTYGACTYTQRPYTVTTNVTLQPGTYCGGLTIGPGLGNSTVTVSLGTGMYVILGPLNVNKANLSGSGITFYLSQGDGYSYGASSIANLSATLTAPTTGNYQGILLYSDPALPAGKASLTLQNWNPGTKLDGILYLPGQELATSNVTLQGANYFGVVADYTIMQNTNFNPSANYSSLLNGTPFTAGKGATLVQ